MNAVADRVFGAVAVAGGIAWAGYVLYFGSDAGLTLPAVLVVFWGTGALLVEWAIWLYVHWRATRGGPRRWIRLALLFPATVAVLAVLTWFGGTFWVRFMLSRPALDRFVRDSRPAILSGQFRPGVRVGLFRIQEAEVLPGGVVRLITTGCMFDDCGVVYSPSGDPPRVGEDYYSSLGQRWWHWWRSW